MRFAQSYCVVCGRVVPAGNEGRQKAFASLAGRKQRRGTGGICRARLRLSRWESSRRSRVRGLYGFLCVLRPLPSRRRLQTLARLQIPLRRTSYATALFSAKPTSVLRAFANQTPLGEACKRASHTCKSLTQGRHKTPQRLPDN